MRIRNCVIENWSDFLGLRLSAAAASALGRNTAEGNHGPAVSAGETAGPSVLGSVPGRIRRDGDLLASIDKSLVNRPVKTVSLDDVGCRKFQGPVDDTALGVFCIQIDPSMWVFNNDFRYFPHQCDGFALIVFRLEGMVRPYRNCNSEQYDRYKCDRNLFH